MMESCLFMINGVGLKSIESTFSEAVSAMIGQSYLILFVLSSFKIPFLCLDLEVVFTSFALVGTLLFEQL